MDPFKVDLFEVLDRDPNRPSLSRSGPVTGIGLPDNVQAGQLLSSTNAIALGAELLDLGLSLRQAEENAAAAEADRIMGRDRRSDP